ncbi:hypothetical protein B0H13DRAFT_2403262 [Mycena leptocephala]|nr:hypothetical protein B0H13DRAFT_2403262 [Mycena leptocephala]
MNFCDGCFKAGEIQGRPCYVATPQVNYPKDKVVLFLPDAHRLALVNNRPHNSSWRIDYVRNVFKVTAVPDLFNGDHVLVVALEPALKSQGVIEMACAGYCFGARYTFDLAFDRLIKVAFVAHPSLLKRLHDLLVRLTRSAVRRGSVARVGGPDPGRRAKNDFTDKDLVEFIPIATLEEVGEDVALLFLSFCDIETVLSMGCVNTFFHRLAQSKQLWLMLIEDLAIRSLADLPRSRSLADHSVQELIDLVKRTVVGPASWSGLASPTLAEQIQLSSTLDAERVEFLPGGRYLFAQWQYTRRVELWNVEADTPVWAYKTNSDLFSVEMLDGGRSVVILSVSYVKASFGLRKN